jgi:type I restriction enzyme M protein
MAVVLPQGALFRKGAEGGIRQKLLEMDLVEASSAWHQTCSTAPVSPPAFWCCARRSPPQGAKKVMIADASRLFRRGRAQNFLEPEHALEIQGWFEKFEDVQDAVRIVSSTKSRPKTGRSTSPATCCRPCRKTSHRCPRPLPPSRMR